ncbi:GxxExxY protein [Phenylobacterium sp.]|nr:GxxExxY protein [Phenylobacterium sp.]
MEGANRKLGEHRAQTINYMRAADMRVGLLVNFGALSAEVERFVL